MSTTDVLIIIPTYNECDNLAPLVETLLETAGQRVVIVDDVLATGGTARAAVRLVESLGATVVGLEFLVELTALDGRRGLDDYRIESVIEY